MAKPKFPKTLIVHCATDLGDDPVYLTAETPEDISEDFADEPVAIYQLLAVGKFNVEKSVDAKPVKKVRVGRQ
jgi:hypothetical protein